MAGGVEEEAAAPFAPDAPPEPRIRRVSGPHALAPTALGLKSLWLQDDLHTYVVSLVGHHVLEA